MDSVMDSFKDEWKALIEPDDHKYAPGEIGPQETVLPDKTRVKREDFFVFNKKG